MNDGYDVIVYATPDGKEPFNKWVSSIKDGQTQRVILRRIQRLRQGLFGDAKALGTGIHELRIDFGPGYRVYFAKVGKRLILLLGGGNKATQNNDIKNAKWYLKDYENNL